MKKMVIRALGALLATVLFTGCLTSCGMLTQIKLLVSGNKNEAITLLDMSSEKVDAATSYVIEMDMSVEGDVNGAEFSYSAVGSETYFDIGGENFTHHMYMEATTAAETFGNITVQDLKIEEGYQNGKMFIRRSDDTGRQRLYSSLTAQEYMTHLEERTGASEPAVDYTACQSIMCAKQDDGGWKMTFADYNSNDVREFTKILSGMDIIFSDGFYIQDVAITIELTDNYYPKLMEISYVFAKIDGVDSDDSDAPEITVRSEYSKFNGITSFETIDFSFYDEISDLRHVYTVQNAINERKNASSGKFKTSISQNSGSKEVNTVSFSLEDGKYSYSATSEKDNYEYLISYADGTQKVAVRDGELVLEESSSESSNYAAKVFIDNLIDPANFDYTNVSSVLSEKDDTVLTITLAKPDTSALETSLSGTDAKLTESSASIVITLQDGKMVKYKYTFEATIRINSYTQSVEIQSVCTFE